MRIDLQTTRSTLRSSCKSVSHPLDIFRILNVFEPRNWKFRITFDTFGNHLHVEAIPPLSARDLPRVLNGSLPAIFSYGPVLIRVDTQLFQLDAEQKDATGERETFFEYRACELGPIHGQLEISGYTITPMLHNELAFRQWLYDHTWLGSREITRRFSCVIELMSYRRTIDIIHVTYPQMLPSFFKKDVALINEGDYFGNFSLRYSMSGPCVLRHRRYGLFVPDMARSRFWDDFPYSSFGVEIEVETQHLQWYTCVGPTSMTDLVMTLDSISRAVSDLVKREGLCCFPAES